jgi:crotonobetainyl-CoA:carnitine CoA-transferase CaiB-like acyl-CoA transferase
MHLSGTPTVVGRPMPGHGGDTDDVLGRWLGMPPADVSELRTAGVIK